MSVQAISAALAIQSCSSAEKFLLIVLANYADHTMRCWPSQARLCSDMSLSQSTMIRLYKGLEAKGLVSRVRRPRRENGTRTSAVTQLHLHSVTVTPGTPQPGVIDDDIQVSSCTQPGVMVTPKPSENHQEEPLARECAPRPDDEDLKKEVLAWADQFTKGARR